MTMPSQPAALACPLCRNQEFQREEGRLDSKWGVTSHKMVLMICTRCRYILHFYDKHSIFDFD
jgi:predicted nucleic-acid-binding Zn-ribbon protein